jgi:mono/diheme cytochrome c family protein
MASAIDWMRRPPPPGMLLVFKLGGGAELPGLPPLSEQPYVTSEEDFTQAQVAEGGKWFGTFCRICHAGPTNPDLFRSGAARDAGAWKAIVYDGALSANGMVGFDSWLSEAQVESIRAYVLSEGRRLSEEEPAN